MGTKDWLEIDGTVASVEERPTRGGTYYTVIFTYEVNGHWCGGTFHTYEAYRRGDSIAVKYDPNDPDRNDLAQRETVQHWIIFGVIAAVAVFVLCVVLK